MNNKIVTSAFKDTLKNKKLSLIILVIVVIFGIVMELIPPQLLRLIIDDNIANGIYEGVWKFSLFYLSAIILSRISDFIREVMIANIGQDALSKIRYNMAKKLKKLPISYYSHNAVGEIMSRFTADVDSVGVIFSEGLVGMIADVLKIIGIIVSIYILSPALALYAIILIPIIYFITKIFNDTSFKAQMLARKTISSLNGKIQEIFTGIRTIKIYGKEEQFIGKMQEPLNDNIKAVYKTSFIDSIFPCLLQILRAVIITILVLIAAPTGIGTLGITIGGIAAAISLISDILKPIEEIAVEFQTIQEALSGLKRIQEFENEKEENKLFNNNDVDKTNINDDIYLNNVSFGYKENINTIENISFSVKKGEKVAILGRTGAGKTTTLSLVAGMYEQKKGAILVNGQKPFHMKPEERRKIIGIVPQNIPIYDGTIKDAITLYDKNITDEQVINATKLVGLHDEIMKMPNGYDTEIGEGKIKFSNGEQQLLTLACALVCEPPILLLDEVTSGLDSLTEKRIFKVIKKVSKDRTILTISHRISGVINADKIVVMENGKIVESGTGEALLKKDGWYSNYVKINELGWGL